MPLLFSTAILLLCQLRFEVYRFTVGVPMEDVDTEAQFMKPDMLTGWCAYGRCWSKYKSLVHET